MTDFHEIEMIDITLWILILTLILASLMFYYAGKPKKGTYSLRTRLSPKLDTDEIGAIFIEDVIMGGVYGEFRNKSGYYTDDDKEDEITYEWVKHGIINYQGDGYFPRKVYEGDSQNFSVNFHPSFIKIGKKSEEIYSQSTKETLTVTIQIAEEQIVRKFLELELIAAGFSVEGDKKQKQPLSSENLHYQWNCFFPNSGRQTFSLRARIIDSQNLTYEIGKIEFTTKVVKIDHMTQRQIWVLATLSGVFSGLLALVEAIRRLGLW